MHRIQISVDERLERQIKAGAKKLGLSVSSYARLALINGLVHNQGGLLGKAIEDVNENRVEKLSYDEFVKQIDKQE